MRIVRLLLLSFIIVVPACTASATVFTVNNFSKSYYGKINIDDTSQVFSPGWVAIYDSRTNKELIKVASEELALSLHEGKALANIKELPYGEQSLIIYEDFNFDGIKDFALEDGQNSCYHGPSFQVFLADKNGFTEDAAFTQLAQENCGMFQVDEKTKNLSTMTKSGCCWHQFATYKVIENTPVATRITEVDNMRFPYETVTTEIHEGKNVAKTSKRTLNAENEIKTVLSFRLEKNNKEVKLFIYEGQLHYCFSGTDGNIEFAYPSDTEEEQPVFTLSADKTHLAFTNKEARYGITETAAGTAELTVITGGKTYRSAGKPGKTGTLKQLPAGLENVK